MKALLITIVSFTLICADAVGQCSICTKTAQQLGDGPAHGLNSGIIYLAFIPLLAIGIVGFRWWNTEKHNREEEDK